MAKRAPAEKLNLYKLFAADYAATRQAALVEVSPATYLAVSGRGEPGSPVFHAKIGALYNVAFTVKMARKFAGRDYAVSMLEGLWWGSGAGAFLGEPRQNWNWTLLIRTPDFITRVEVKGAIERLLRKGKPADVSDVTLEPLKEGLSVQMLHVGPYDREPESLAKMHAFGEAQGLVFHGRHHEVYLSDPRRVAPAKLRTILRLPAAAQAGVSGSSGGYCPSNRSSARAVWMAPLESFARMMTMMVPEESVPQPKLWVMSRLREPLTPVEPNCRRISSRPREMEGPPAPSRSEYDTSIRSRSWSIRRSPTLLTITSNRAANGWTAGQVGDGTV